METGIHNNMLAIYIALSVIGNSAIIILPAVYRLIMFLLLHHSVILRVVKRKQLVKYIKTLIHTIHLYLFLKIKL